MKAEIANGNVQLILGHIEDLPFESKTFDRIYHCNCFYYWSDILRCSRELHRVLKPGGLMVTTLNTADLRDSKRRGVLPNTMIDPEIYMSYLQKAGFQNVFIENKKNHDFWTRRRIPEYQAIFAHVS